MQDPLHIRYIGHATCMIRSATGSLMMDPHFGRRVLAWPRLHRLQPDPRWFSSLTAVLITSAHYDHLDIEGFKYIASSVPVIVPVGVAKLLARFINNPVIELAHWVPYALTADITITPIPVRHIGGRLIPHVRYRHVNGYLITMEGTRIYCSGDTAYGTHFREVGHMHPIDVALLPVGRLAPGRWLGGRALTNLEMIQAVLDLKATHAIPIHWGTFGSAKAAAAQIEQLQQHAANRQLGNVVHVIQPMSSFCFSPGPTVV